MANPYAPPSADIETNHTTLEPVGFWMRVLASVIDNILLAVIAMSLLFSIYGTTAYLENEQFVTGGADLVITYIMPAILIIAFWIYRQATPGKMLISAKIVDAETGKKPSTGQFIGRYFAYIPSAIVFGLGFLWVAWDKRKQGWHDKLAGTMVVRAK